MKYFIDTEFLEGSQKRLFGKTKPTIDLISIGIVAEDGREYYAISKDFNLKEAWNRYDLKPVVPNSPIEQRNEKVYWLRTNVLLPMYEAWVLSYCGDQRNRILDRLSGKSDYRGFKIMLSEIGKTNKDIAYEVFRFIHKDVIARYDDRLSFAEEIVDSAYKYHNEKDHELYGYYCDYDWVVFCWLFGKMIDLPKGFPMYCRDLKQMLDEKNSRLIGGTLESPYKDVDGETITAGMFIKGIANHSGCSEVVYKDGNWQPFSFLNEESGSGFKIIRSFKEHPQYPKQTNEHNALADAKWDFELYKFLKTL